MPFTYAIPLSTFDDLLDKVKPALRSEVTQRLRTEIHADLARRMTGPDIGTPTGWARTYYDSTVAHGDILFYSPFDYHDAVEKTGAPRPTLSSILFPKQGLMKDPQAMLLLRNQKWRYPGDAGNGIFAASVNAVLARKEQLLREYRQ